MVTALRVCFDGVTLAAYGSAFFSFLNGKSLEGQGYVFLNGLKDSENKDILKK